MALGDAEEFDRRRMRREELRQKRRKEQKRLIMGLVIAGIVLIACGVVLFMVSRGQNVPEETTPPEQTSPTETLVSTQPTVETTAATESDNNTVIRITAAGDLNVTDLSVAAGGAGYDYTRAFQDVMPLLAEADLTVLNFEGNLCGAPYGTETRSAPQKMVEALVTAGVDMVQMANSCAIVNGIIGLNNTLSNLRMAGLEPLGAYASEYEFNKSGGYTIRNIQGIKVALVAFTKGMDGMALPAGSEKCVNLLYEDYATTYQKVDKDGIRRVLRDIEKEKPDITIALVHWGSEYNDNRSDTQDTIRDLMIAGGVDAIIGTHPHYVHPIEYDEEEGTLVAYSLGDFFSDGTRSGTEYSIMLHLEITKDAATGQTRISGYSYTPLFTVAEEGKPNRVIRLHEGIAGYEHTYVDRVQKDTYDDMLYARTRIEERVNPPEEEDK